MVSNVKLDHYVTAARADVAWLHSLTSPEFILVVQRARDYPGVTEFEDDGALLIAKPPYGFFYKPSVEVVHLGKCTSRPSKYYMLKPMNTAGTAMIMPGYYEKVYKTGSFKGRPCLVQVGDIDYDRYKMGRAGSVSSGKATTGLHVHDCGGSERASTAEYASAGCIVFQEKSSIGAILSAVGTSRVSLLVGSV